MMASNASHMTIRKIATPAAKAPGAGIMCGIVPVRQVPREREKPCDSGLGFEAGADADFGLEQFRNWTARFRGLYRSIKFPLVRARNFSDKVEMTLGDRETVGEFLQRDCRRRLQLFSGQSGAPKLRRKRHGEATGMRRGEKFLRIGTDSVFKS